MKRAITNLAAAAVLGGFSGAALAAETGFSMALQGGITAISTSSLDAYYTNAAGSAFTNTTQSNLLGITNGGYAGRVVLDYAFTPRVAVEATGMYLRRFYYMGKNGTGGTLSARTSGYGSSLTLVSITSHGEPGDQLSLLFKLGLAAIHGKSTITSTGTLSGATRAPLGNGNQIGATYGVALQSNITERILFRVDWDSYLPNSATGGGRFNTWMAGFSYSP